MISQVLRKFGREAVACNEGVSVSLWTMDSCAVSFTELRGRLDERVEHNLQIECRATNDLKHVGGGRLLLQRFSQLIQQSRILDRDHGLCCEILNHCDLLVGEGANFLA